MAEAITTTPEGDLVDRVCVQLTGSRWKILRVNTYYGLARGVVLFSAGLPVVRSVAPTAENVANVVLKKVGAPEVRELDPLIIENLEKVDVYVDEVKDQALVKLREGKDIVVEKVKDNKMVQRFTKPKDETSAGPEAAGSQ